MLKPRRYVVYINTLEFKMDIAKKQGKMEQWGKYLEEIMALKDSVHNKQNTIGDLSYNNLQLAQERVKHEMPCIRPGSITSIKSTGG